MNRLVGTSSPERTLDQHDLASLRPAAQPKPREPRSAPVLREVTSGIVCFCGERFGEHRALEFMLHLRAEVGETLNWAEHQKKRRREARRAYRAKPEVQERRRARERERRAIDPEYRERVNAQRRQYDSTHVRKSRRT